MRPESGTESLQRRSWATWGYSMFSAAYYRELAADCLWTAKFISAPNDRALLVEMAATWLRLAELAEGWNKAPAPEAAGRDPHRSS
jgi:hypothetical protein